MSHSDVDEDEVKHEAGKTKPRHFVHIDCSGLSAILIKNVIIINYQ